MRYQLVYLVDDKWDLTGKEYADPQMAVVAVVAKLGESVQAEQEPNGFRIKRCRDGATVAAARIVSDALVLRPSQQHSSGLQGPLRRWHGLSWVGWLNYLLLRWLLIRLVYYVEPDNTISNWTVCFVPRFWRW